MKKNKNYEISSGNIFADLGLPNPEERLAKAELARQINGLIKQKNLTQSAAAELLDIDQPKISDLNKGKLAGFSLERLFKFLNILGQDITIKIKPKPRAKRKAMLTINHTPAKKKPLPKQKQTSSIGIYAQKKK